MRWLFFISDKVCLPIAILGVVIYYATAFEISLYMCAAWLILHSVLNCIYGGQNNLYTELLTFGVSGAVALMFDLQFWPCVAVSYCIVELAFVIPAFIWLARYFFGGRKN